MAATAGCGYLDPPEDPTAARALYDEGEGAVRLFVARQWIPGEPAAERYHTVTANAENAFLHQQTLNVSGGRDHQALSARGVGTLGLFDRAHLSADWYYTQQRYRSRSDDDFQFDNVYYRHDLGQAHYLQAGRMDRRNLSSPQGGTFSFSMLPLDRFQGARVGTTQAYVDTDAAVQATPLTVLLARDARVDVFDGERLLQTFYPGGHQPDRHPQFPVRQLPGAHAHLRGRCAGAHRGGAVRQGRRLDQQPVAVVRAGRPPQRAPQRPLRWRTRGDGRPARAARDAALTAGVANLGGHSYGELRLDLRHVLATHEMRATLSGMRAATAATASSTSCRTGARRRGISTSSACAARPASSRPMHATSWAAPTHSAARCRPVAGGNVYVGYTRRQTWRTGWHQPGFEQDPFFGLEPLLPPGPLEPRREPVLSRTWQASFSRSHRWQDFSVSTRVGLWQQRSADSVRQQRA